MSSFNKFRVWLAGKLLGRTPYIKNVTFYQTVCLDSNCGIIMDGVRVNLNHDLNWKSRCDGMGFVFDRYRDHLNEL